MVTAETKLADIFKTHKGALEVFERFGLACPGCKGQAEDTVGKVAVNYGLDVKAFVDALNEAG